MSPTKIISLGLAAVMTAACVLTAVSCKKTEAPQEDPYDLAHIRTHLTEYTLVRGDTASKVVNTACLKLLRGVKAVAGYEMAYVTDFDGPTEDNTDRLEILVGDTNRQASADAKALLTPGAYSLNANGKKIVIMGDDASIGDAVDRFLSMYLNYGESDTGDAKAEKKEQNHNVADYGAKGDGKTDDTSAFKKAIKAAEGDGLPVYVPGGTYMITDTLTLNEVTLYGYDTGAWTADSCDLPTLIHGDMEAPLVDVRSGSISGLNLSCKDSTKTNLDLQPTVLITGTGGRVSDLTIRNPYIGIMTDDKSNAGRCFINNIFIVQAAKIGVHVAGTYDVPQVNNVEVWNNDMEHSCPAAFEFGHNDDIRCVNLFAFNAQVGFKIIKTSTGTCWGSFTNCSVDYTSIGFEVGSGAHHLTIVGGTYWTHHMGVHVLKENTDAIVTVTGCEMKSNGERTLNIEGGKMVTVSGCNIIRDFDAGTFPAVEVSGGTNVTITGNTVICRAPAFSIKAPAKSNITVTGNTVQCKDGALSDANNKGNLVFENNAIEDDHKF